MAIVVTLSPRALASSSPSRNPLWADIDASIEMADYDLALALLAELSADESQRAAALQKAAEIYLEQGNESEAIGLLEQAVLLPGNASAANTLARLFYRKRDYAEIVRLYEMHVLTRWEKDVLLLIRNALLVEGRDGSDLPAETLEIRQTDTLSLSYAGNVYVSEYAPYSDDTSITDSELHSSVSIQLTYPWREDTDLIGRVIVEDDQSLSSPESFHPYQTQSYGLHSGFRRRTGNDGILRCDVGITQVDRKHYADADIGGQETEWTYAVSMTQPFTLGELRLGGYRSLFGSPTLDNYTTERTDVKYLGAALHPHGRWEFDGAYTDIHHTGDLEDYGLLAGTIRYAPAKWPSLGLSCGAERELRERDQNTLFGGLDSVLELPAQTLLLASAMFYANNTTRERDILVELIVTKRSTAGKRWAFGLSGRQEININDRRSLQLFVRLQ